MCSWPNNTRPQSKERCLTSGAAEAEKGEVNTTSFRHVHMICLVLTYNRFCLFKKAKEHLVVDKVGMLGIKNYHEVLELFICQLKRKSIHQSSKLASGNLTITILQDNMSKVSAISISTKLNETQIFLNFLHYISLGDYPRKFSMSKE